MAAYLDLMAFAKGAELANQANWKDTMNDISSRSAEEQLRQSQDVFNLNMPLAELGTGKKIEDFQGNQMSFDFQSSLNKELAGMPEEQRGAYQAQTVLNALKNMDMTRPGSQAYQRGLVDYGTKAVSDLVKAGRFEDANALARSLPGVSNTGRLAEAQSYMRPGALNDAVSIAAAGGEMQPSGKVRFRGSSVDLDPLEFAQIRARQAQDPSFNPLSALAEIDKRNRDLTFQNEVAAKAKAMGMEVMVNPVTGQRVVLPRAQALQAQSMGSLVPAPAPQAAARTPVPAAAGAAPQAGTPAFAPSAAAGAAPVYWPDPSGTGFAQAIANAGQPTAPAAAGPSWWDRLVGAFGTQTANTPGNFTGGMPEAIMAQPNAAPSPVQFSPSQNGYNPPWWMSGAPTNVNLNYGMPTPVGIAPPNFYMPAISNDTSFTNWATQGRGVR